MQQMKKVPAATKETLATAKQIIKTPAAMMLWVASGGPVEDLAGFGAARSLWLWLSEVDFSFG